MIEVTAKAGLVQKTFKLYQNMKKAGHKPKGNTYFHLLLVWLENAVSLSVLCQRQRKRCQLRRPMLERAGNHGDTETEAHHFFLQSGSSNLCSYKPSRDWLPHF
jgi:pentatricopeptide repeat protein